MPALSEPQLPTQQPAADTTACWDAANKRALHLLFGAQRIMVGEMAFAFEAMYDRIRTETHLFGEFAAKLAGSHSVHDWNAMGGECSQHQLEFLRRDCDRLLRHGERLAEATSSLLDNRG